MIKEFFLKYKGKPFTPTREHSTYTDAVKFGILYNADEFKPAEIEALEKGLMEDNKEISTFGFKVEEDASDRVFSKKDITMTGSIKPEKLIAFKDQAFDFMISLDTGQNINYRYILSISKAICKVGLQSESYADLLQLAMKKEVNNATAIANLLKYLRKI